MQPDLQIKVSNIEMEFCETLNVIGASGSVGSISASLKSTCEYCSIKCCSTFSFFCP